MLLAFLILAISGDFLATISSCSPNLAVYPLYFIVTFSSQCSLTSNIHSINLFQIQRKLQLRIEEQGKQLKMMFDQQQKTTDSHLITENNDRPISSKDVLVSIYEGSENSLFSSKIS